jgi:choline dehydrogenase
LVTTTYASRADLDAWAALGNPGFEWDEMVSYLQKFNTFHLPSPDGKLMHQAGNIDESLYTTSGPIHTSYYPWMLSTTKTWVDTWKNLGLLRKTDPRSGVALGGSSALLYIDPDTVTRSYAATGFYAPNAHRPNFFVLVEAYVNKIQLETSKGDVRATGVDFTAKGKRFIVTARREVILCAGTVKSPQLLELSGVGSSSLLESLGIPVMIANEGVGENLRDHPRSIMSNELADGITSLDSLGDPAALEETRMKYRTEPLQWGVCTGDAYIVLSDVLSDDDKVSLARLVDEIDAMDVPAGVKRQHRILTKFLVSPSEPSGQYLLGQGGTDGDKVRNYVSISACVPHPFSRGSIHITTADPIVDPAIDPRYLSHPADRFMLAKLVQYMQKIASTEPFGSQLKPQGYQLMTEEQALDHISLTCTTLFHPIGTCAMLPREDGGVVDPRLKVYGIGNLRIVDASIFPIHVQNNICSTVYTVAEKAADMIKEDWS